MTFIFTNSFRALSMKMVEKARLGQRVDLPLTGSRSGKLCCGRVPNSTLAGRTGRNSVARLTSARAWGNGTPLRVGSLDLEVHLCAITWVFADLACIWHRTGTRLGLEHSERTAAPLGRSPLIVDTSRPGS
jgi:hypothetical protein